MFVPQTGDTEVTVGAISRVIAKSAQNTFINLFRFLEKKIFRNQLFKSGFEKAIGLALPLLSLGELNINFI